MIKNIIFDIAGIFITSDEEEIIRNYSVKLNIPYETLRSAYDSCFKDYESGKLVREEFTKLFFNKADKEVPDDFWVERIKLKHRFWEMFDFLNILKENYDCYFISNEGKEYWGEIDSKLDISSNFINGIVSFEAKIRKPDTKIFKMLIERNDLDVSETVFIDDSVDNLDGAEEIGIKGIHYTNIQKLKEDLGELGLKWNT